MVAEPPVSFVNGLPVSGVPTFEAVAYTGEGVFPTLKTLAAMVLESIEKIDGRNQRRPAARSAGAGFPVPMSIPR